TYLLTRSRGRSVISKLFGTASCALCPVLSRIETFTVTVSADEALMRATAGFRFGLIVIGILNSRAGLIAAICAFDNFSVDGRSSCHIARRPVQYCEDGLEVQLLGDGAVDHYGQDRLIQQRGIRHGYVSPAQFHGANQAQSRKPNDNIVAAGRQLADCSSKR